MQKPLRTLYLNTLTLLLIAASRILLLADLSFDHDEVWSVWQTFGSPQEIIARTPFDWPPLYYLSLGAWRVFVGMHPVVLRMSSVLLFMVGVVLVYRLAQKLFQDDVVAWLAMLAYAGLGYVVYLSVLLRAYAAVMMLLPLGLLLVMHYFEQPTIRRGIVLGVTMAIMFYLTLSAVFAFLVMGIFALFLYPRQILRWWLPGLTAAGVAAIEIWDKLGMVANRVSVELALPLDPLPQAYLWIYQRYLGYSYWLWFAILLLATGLILFQYFNRRAASSEVDKHKAPLIFLLMWMLTSPLLLYAIHSRTNFFGPRYSWWVAPAIALWIGYGLSRLPRTLTFVAGIGLMILLFVPQNIASYKQRSPNFEQNVAWLAQHMQPTDVLMIDPHCDCGRLEQWDYYMRVYFENDVQVVDDVRDAYRRIWYVRTSGAETTPEFAAVQDRRAPGLFSGTPDFFFQLYVLPPDVDGILFENGLRFHGVEVLDEDGLETAQVLRPEGSTIRIRLWWSVDEPLSQEYSVGVQVINSRTGQLLTQDDKAPIAMHLDPTNDAPLPTTMMAWQPRIFHLEERTLEIPFGLRREAFTVYLTVYDWRDGRRFAAEGVNDNMLLPLFNFEVMAW